MVAYYNEIDPYAAKWLENLISAGHIAPGDVDTRSIVDITPSELAKYTQCHFFAGVGVWSYALRRAGWPDERPVWTGSCPCQPFSAAGQGGGFDDERHLWPAFYHLIDECRPDALFGEQVASKDGLAWLDLVQADMEAAGYAFGAFDLCAAGFGAPHIRQRLYWTGSLDHAADARRGEARQHDGGSPLRPARSVESGRISELADAADAGLQWRRPSEAGDGRDAPRIESERLRDAGLVADSEHCEQRQGRRSGSQSSPRDESRSQSSGRSLACELADTDGPRSTSRISAPRHGQEGHAGILDDGGGELRRSEGPFAAAPPGPTNGPWRDADWLLCRDGKWRPVRPGTFPLAHGAPSRVGRLRAYGNAIVASQAEAFVSAFLEIDAGVNP